MPFTQEQFFAVFRDYNLAVWPVQLLLNAAALIAVVLAARARSGRAVALILATLWIWMAIAYHLSFFARINRAAIGFGIAFLLEGLIFLWLGVVRGRLRFEARRDCRTALGLVLIVYALLIYPSLGYLLGRRYPEMPTFGLPCPTTIFTFGLLLWVAVPFSLSVIVIPALWSALGSAAASSLGITEDYGLLIAGLLATTSLLVAQRRQSSHLGSAAAMTT